MTSETTVRRFPRVRMRLEAEVWQGGTHWPGIITVLSAKGALLETDAAVEVGSTVGLRFTVPGSETNIVCGAVVRNQPGATPAVGLEFVLAPGDRERVADVIEVAAGLTYY